MLGKLYNVKLTLTEPILGTVPKNKDIYTDYIASKAEKAVVLTPEQESDTEAVIQEEIGTVPVDENKGWTGFHSDDEGVFLYDYQIKGFIKEAGNVLKEVAGADGVKVGALRSKIDSYVFVFPRRIHFGCNILPEPLERPLRALTAMGPRVTLVRSDQIAAGTVLSFQLRVLPHKEITEALLRQLFDYGAFQGLGQWRNGSYGRFEFELEEIKS